MITKEIIRVLLVEDNSSDAMLVQDELEHTEGEHFSVVHVEQLKEAVEKLKAQPFDVILLDLSLPDSHGFETFVKLHEAALDVPVVVLSGRSDGKLAVQAVQAGAQDYLVKGRLGEDVLPRSIRYAIERQRSEKTLAESEERYRLLIQHSPHGYMVHCDGKIVFVNDACMKLFRADRPEQLLGKSYLETVAPEFRELVSQRVQNVEGDQSNPPIEVLSLRLDGTTVAVEGRSNSFVHEGKLAVQVVLHDITERKQAEASQREWGELLQAIFDNIPVMLCFVDREGKIQWVNREAERILGWSAAEIEAASDVFAQWYPEPEYRASVLTFIRESTGKFVEFQIRTRSGTSIPTSWAAVTLADGTSVGIGLDITERKRSEQRFRWLVESNAQGVMYWNAKGEITGGNDAFLRMVGYTRTELEAGQIDLSTMTPPEYAEIDRLNQNQIGARGVCAPYEKAYFRKDGSRVPILIGAATFEDNSEEGVCFMIDLTERKKVEENALRTQRMESIGTLAGGIAHDLNNTLSPIIMSLDLLQMRFPDSDSQELLSIISASAQRGAEMVSQVLSFARGVEGRRMEVQVKHVLRDVAKIVNDTFLKNIQVSTVTPNDLWTIQGDPTQLHQVLLNLCVNARDAMPNGGALKLSAENLILDEHYVGLAWSMEAKPGPFVVLTVKDNGTGMPPDVIEKIFDPFFTTKEIGHGTGLGLSTSLAILKSHSAVIRVYSELGKGTEFKVYLPAQLGTSESVAAQQQAEMPRGNRELILVVDDEMAVREITHRTLETYGYRVLLASDGAEGLAIFARQGSEIAVVITDMMMPVMDGPTAIQLLRRLNPEVKIIAASGLSATGDQSYASLPGIQRFLPKPYTAETLLKTLRQVIVGDLVDLGATDYQSAIAR